MGQTNSVAVHGSRRSTTSAITIPVVNETMAQVVGMEPSLSALWESWFDGAESSLAGWIDMATRSGFSADDAEAYWDEQRYPAIDEAGELCVTKTPERIIRAITYACPCGGSCRQCGEDNGTRIADVDDWSVTIGAISYDRGIESDERIAAALESVDEECREDLEWLLRHGPGDDVDSPAMRKVIERAEREPRAVTEPTDIMETLREEMRRSIQDSSLPFKEKCLEMAKLGAGGAK